MTFVSLWFVVLFLPCSLLLYTLIPERGRNLALLVISLLFYSQLGVFHLVFMTGSVVFDYLLSRMMQRYDDDNRRRRNILILAAVKNFGIALLAGMGYDPQGGNIPVGLYIYLFSALGYLIDIYRGDEVYERNFVRFALYCVMFPRIVAGPMFSYNSFRTQLNCRKLSLERISRGMCLFIYGFAKQTLLLPSLQSLTQELYALYPENLTMLSAWMLVLCVTLCYYYRLCAWCEMAEGLGVMFGFRYTSGFDYPLVSSGVYDFQQRFHGSVISFIRKYASVQLSADPNGIVTAVFNLLVSSVLLGMWYSANLNGIVWGVYIGVLLVLEQCVLLRYFPAIPSFFRRIATGLLIFPSFMLLVNPGSEPLRGIFQAMAGMGVSPISAAEQYILSTYWLPLAAGIAFAFPLLRPLHRCLSLPPINRRMEITPLTVSNLLLRISSLALAVGLMGLYVVLQV